MAGEAPEYYDHNGNNDWLVGADIFKSSSGALRSAGATFFVHFHFSPCVRPME